MKFRRVGEHTVVDGLRVWAAEGQKQAVALKRGDKERGLRFKSSKTLLLCAATSRSFLFYMAKK